MCEVDVYNRVAKSRFVSKMMPKQCCDVTQLICTHRLVNGHEHGPAQCVQLSFVATRHCLASFWGQTNFKISQDVGALSDMLLESNRTIWGECIFKTHSKFPCNQNILRKIQNVFWNLSQTWVCVWEKTDWNK